MRRQPNAAAGTATFTSRVAWAPLTRGETLVVETTHIDWPWFDQTGVPQTAAIELLERFALSDNGLRLDYAVTATDPVTFTEAVVLTRDWIWLPGETVQPYECTIQEGNY